MRGSAVSESAIKINTKDFSIKERLAPEYVLKVEMPDEEIVDVKSVSPKNNPNPENLPAIRKGINWFLRKTLLLVLLFVFAFLISVLIEFNFVFFLLGL